MKQLLRVAVSQRVDEYPDRGEKRDALDRKLVDWLAKVGCLAYPVPNRAGGFGVQDSHWLDDWLMALSPQVIVLSGGNDIGTVPERDVTEQCLLSYATRQSLPLLGICRGMQMMGVAAGASLISVAGHARTRHRLCLNGKIISPSVNSFHNQALSDCPSGYEVIARSEDGHIEAIRHRVLAREGWMWHPERDSAFCEIDIERARRLFDA